MQLGENGANISGGQGQRIGIARAIYADKPILLLDEATSALDKDTQRTVISNVKSLAKTVIMITHDADVLHQCDKIINIADGTVTFQKLPE
jgi:ABC-type bacteriocin/lantibiotic exporter with double-glycine peptidase domain